MINKPNTWIPGENIIGLNKDGNFIIKKGCSVSTVLATGFLSLILSNEVLNQNENFKNRYIRNVYSMILKIRDSNVSLPNINFSEITSGVFNPDGLFNLLLFKLKEFDESSKLKYNFNFNSHNLTGLKNNSYTENNFYNTDKKFSLVSNPVYFKKISLFNNILDFSLKYFSNYTISSKNKLNNNKLFYSTKQPELIPLLFYQDYLGYSDENVIKLVNEIKIIRSQRKTDIFQCLKVKSFKLNYKIILKTSLNFLMRIIICLKKTLFLMGTMEY